MQVATFRAAGAASGDTTPPTVPSPLRPRTVSGTVTLTANATDNVGVAGVQFLVDNNPWRRGHHLALQRVVEHHDGGQRHHTLTALARDTSGNTALRRR